MTEPHNPAGSTVTPPHGTPKPITRICAECAQPYAVRMSGPGQNSKFCPGEVCRRAFDKRKLAQGAPLVPLLKAWRLARNAKERRELGAACLSELSSIVDGFNEADRKDGRTSEMTLAYAADLLSGGRRYIDRARR